MHSRWELLPGNEGLTEPRYTNFHYIKHITPEAKIIIIFRDPVSRLVWFSLPIVQVDNDESTIAQIGFV